MSEYTTGLLGTIKGKQILLQSCLEGEGVKAFTFKRKELDVTSWVRRLMWNSIRHFCSASQKCGHRSQHWILELNNYALLEPWRPELDISCAKVCLVLWKFDYHTG